MKSLLKATVVCFLTVFTLCLNVKGKPIFEAVYSVLSHLTVPVQNGAESLLASAIDSAQDYTKKIFNNSLPKVKDAVRSRASAPRRTRGEARGEEIVEDKEELDELIKSHY